MLSIIIPVLNGQKTLAGLLDSIQHSYFKNYEVIVVDDSSSDDTVSIIKSYAVKGVFLPVHSGMGAARNKGAEIAQGEILVFFDSDTEVEPDTLGKIAKRFKENQDIKVLVGTYADRPLNKGYFPRFKALWFKSLFKDTDTYTDSLEGFCVAVDKEVFNSVGGFNPSRAGDGDYELGCRLRQKYKLYFDAGIQVRHNFPGFLKNGFRFFRRTYEFIPLFLSQSKSYRGHTLDRDGFASISSFVSFLLLPFVVAHSLSATLLFLIFIVVFIFFARRFIKLVFYKEGLFFTITSIITYYVNGIIVSFAIVLGTLHYLLILINQKI